MAEIDNAVMANVAAFLERLKAAGMQLCSPEKLMRNGKCEALLSEDKIWRNE